MTEVYFDIVKYSLNQKEHELDVLGYIVRFSENFSDVTNQFGPLKMSWLPDWRNHTTIGLFPKFFQKYNPATDETLRTNSYCASGTLPIALNIDRAYLNIHGCAVDVIDQLSPHWHDEQSVANIKDWLPQNAPVFYPTGEPL